MASSKVIRGRMVGIRRASMVLPEPGGPIIRILCAAGRRHLQGPLGVLLPLDLGEVVAVFGMLPEEFVDIHPVGGNLPLAVEEPDHLGQFGDADDVDPLHHCRLAGVLPGQDDPGKPLPPGRHRHRQGAPAPA